MNMKKTIIALFILINFRSSISQVVINEIMYAPADAANEWFEILNTGNTPVDLQNWKWKDATSSIRNITSQSIILLPDSFIVICQDSVKLKSQFTSLYGKTIQTSWSALNNTGDNVIVLDPDNNRRDSVSFIPSWGGNNGDYSLEKINSAGSSNNSANWGTSISLHHATPGKNNSITPKPFDLYLKSFTVSPVFPVVEEDISLEFAIRNTGSNNAGNFSLNIFKDDDLDSLPEIHELINSHAFVSLNSFDSVQYDYYAQNTDTGYNQFIAKVIFDQDYDTLNNMLIRRVYVSSNSVGGGGMVINEIMYDPLSNKSEWIELYNATGQSLNLRGWKYKEASTSVTLFSNDLFFNPGDYLIIAHDSTIYDTFEFLRSPQINQIVKISTGISLNNTGENISITDSLNNVIDAVFYDPGWNNPELPDTKGISLERINPSLKSNDRSNWSSCADLKGGTPGLKNSIFTENKTSNSIVMINPNPFSPDNDGYEDFTLIKYRLNFSFGQMKVKIFDIKGRQVRELANNQITGSEGTIIFNGLDNDNKKLRIGIYLLLIEAIDERGGTIEIVKKPLVIAGKM